MLTQSTLHIEMAKDFKKPVELLKASGVDLFNGGSLK
jgi:hypothetical protein